MPIEGGAPRTLRIIRIRNRSYNPAAEEEMPARRRRRTITIFHRATGSNNGGPSVLNAQPVSSATLEVMSPPRMGHGCSKEAIAKFVETRKFEELAAVDGGGDPEVCAVCLEPYRGKEMIGILGCQHRFHAQCIGDWLQNKNVCPLCKAIGISETDLSCRN